MMIYEMLTNQQLMINMMKQEALQRAPDATADRIEWMVDRFFAQDPLARGVMEVFTREIVLPQATRGDIREIVSLEFEVSDGGDPRFVPSLCIETEALNLICSTLVVAEDRPSMADIMAHPFFDIDYSEATSSDADKNRFRTVRALQHMNAGEAAMNTAMAMRSLSVTSFNAASSGSST